MEVCYDIYKCFIVYYRSEEIAKYTYFKVTSMPSIVFNPSYRFKSTIIDPGVATLV